MSINSFDLHLANRVQEKGNVFLNQTKEMFGKSPSTVRRSIQNINEYLPLDKQFLISDLVIINQLTYKDHLTFIQSLSFSDYIPNQEERFEFIIASSFINDSINLTELYVELGLSLSTKKYDRHQIEAYLAKEHLSLKSIPGKGVSIYGNELRYRLYITQLLVKVCELDENNYLIERQANNPLERKLFQLYNNRLFPSQESSVYFLTSFLKENDFRSAYVSKKFFYLYFLIANYRSTNNNFLVSELLPLKITNYTIMKNTNENSIINSLLCSLDFNEQKTLQFDSKLGGVTQSIIQSVEEKIITTFYTKNTLFKQCYDFLYKVTLRNFLKYEFYDNKLEDTKKEFPFLFNVLSSELTNYNKDFYTLNENQIATLTLIFRNHVLKNKISGRNRKRIIIVTNSAKEKTNFFAELLNYYMDVEIIEDIHINELYRIRLLKFDYLITFSNRISSILAENNYPVIKLNYYLHDEDIDLLLNLNFSSNSNRKLIAEDICKELNSIPQNEHVAYLINNYPNFFI